MGWGAKNTERYCVHIKCITLNLTKMFSYDIPIESINQQVKKSQAWWRIPVNPTNWETGTGGSQV